MKFTKMQGAGNDYIYVNAFDERVENPAALAVTLSDRHFGVGGDGLVLIRPSARADCFMDIYNADGSRAQMCGNAVRCVAKYVCDRGLVTGDTVQIETLSGIKAVEVLREGGAVTAARVNMGAPALEPASLPADFPGESVVSQKITIPVFPESQKLTTADGEVPVTCVSMGNPHCVVFVDDTKSLDLARLGPVFEHHARFPERVNTEFVQTVSDTEFLMRVWERGSGETLACGTGACAATVASVLNGRAKRGADVRVRLTGGELTICWSAGGDVYMTGPAAEVFTGEIRL